MHGRSDTQPHSAGIISLIATLDLVVQSKSNGSVLPVAFYGFDNPHHILRLVKHLVVDLRIGQRAVVAQRLQGSRTDVKLSADLLVVHPAV